MLYMSCQGRPSTRPLCPTWALATWPHTHPRSRWEACRVWVLALLCHLNKSSALSESLVEWCVGFPLLPLHVTTNTVAQNNTIVLSCGSVGQKSHTGPTGLRARCPEALGENPFAGLSQLPEAPSFRGWRAVPPPEPAAWPLQPCLPAHIFLSLPLPPCAASQHQVAPRGSPDNPGCYAIPQPEQSHLQRPLCYVR